MLNGLVTVHPLVLAKANSTVNRVTELDDDWMLGCPLFFMFDIFLRIPS